MDKGVVLPIATKPTQQTIINDWAAQQQDEILYCYGSVHPDAPDVLEELERIRQLGLHGIKLHPDYQGFFADEPRMLPIYRRGGGGVPSGGAPSWGCRCCFMPGSTRFLPRCGMLLRRHWHELLKRCRS